MKQLGFKTQPWRQAVIRVRWPGEAIEAPMFTLPIGVNGSFKRNVGRLFIGDDLPCRVHRQSPVERWRGYVFGSVCAFGLVRISALFPTIAGGGTFRGIESIGSIADCTVPLLGLIGWNVKHAPP